MKLFSLQVLYKTDAKPKLLQGAYELSSFSFFQRGSVQEFLEFTAKLVCERTAVCSRAAVHENGKCISPLRFTRTVVLEDFSAEYPPSTWATMSAGYVSNFHFTPHYRNYRYRRLVPVLLLMILFLIGKYRKSCISFKKISTDISFRGANMRKLGEYLVKYQDPCQADSLSRLQADVEDTTQILHQTLETLIERGEKLDDLVSKSEDLSSQSKLFYQTVNTFPYFLFKILIFCLQSYLDFNYSLKVRACIFRGDPFL
ncbi:unnamed protein product [Taenia asiatica]|uniref:V-SNARE coiled-coil homology domain-containing protein n=1 Tax=Taenia asiatica TaxID=60517 RepID=A0A0R3VSI1_TAEAS|nr:unnamed protein product [Taenia asiatica]